MGPERLIASVARAARSAGLAIVNAVLVTSLAPACGSPAAQVAEPVPKRAGGRHLQIFRAPSTQDRAAIALRFAERNGPGWELGGAVDRPGLEAVDPVFGYVRRGKRSSMARSVTSEEPFDEAIAAEVATAFLLKNADLLGVHARDVPLFNVEVGRISEESEIDRRLAIVMVSGEVPMKGYEAFTELRGKVDMTLFVEADRSIRLFENRSLVHPRLSLDTRPDLDPDDPRVFAGLLGRSLFALVDDPNRPRARPRELPKLPLGSIAREDIGDRRLVIFASAGPGFAWVTYRLAYVVEIAKQGPRDAAHSWSSGPRSAGGKDPSSPVYFFRYVVDADTGEVVEDATAPILEASPE